MDAFPGYTASVGPRENRGLYAQAQANEALGSSVRRIGQGARQIGQDIDDDLNREGQINAMRGRAKLDEHVRTLLTESPQLTFTDDNGLSLHHRIADTWRKGYEIEIEKPDGQRETHKRVGYDKLKKDIAEGLPESMRAGWLAGIESEDEPKWQRAVEERGRELREDYANNTLSWALMGPGMAGDIETANALRTQVEGMFPKEEWPTLSLSIDSQIAYGISRSDPELAKRYAREHIPPTQIDKIESAIDENARAAKAQREQLDKAEKEARDRQVYGNMELHAATQGRQGQIHQPSELTQMFADGWISKSTFDAGMAMSTAPERKTDIEARNRLADAIIQMEQGNLSVAEVEEIERQETPKISNTDLATLHDRLNSFHGALIGNISKNARTEISDWLKPVQVKGRDVIGDVASLLATDAATRMFDREFMDAVKDGKTLSPSDWSKRALEIAFALRNQLEAIGEDVNLDTVEVRQKQLNYLKSNFSPGTIFPDTVGVGALSGINAVTGAAPKAERTVAVGSKVRMRAPDGTVKEFDAQYAEEARQHGYEDL